jgi:hypothetical protein
MVITPDPSQRGNIYNMVITPNMPRITDDPTETGAASVGYNEMLREDEWWSAKGQVLVRSRSKRESRREISAAFLVFADRGEDALQSSMVAGSGEGRRARAIEKPDNKAPRLQPLRR